MREAPRVEQAGEHIISFCSAPCTSHSRAFHLPGKLISSSVARYRRPPREAAHSYRTSSAFAEAADFVLSAEAPAFEVESAPLHADVRGRGTAAAVRARGGARAASMQVRSLLPASGCAMLGRGGGGRLKKSLSRFAYLPTWRLWVP